MKKIPVWKVILLSIVTLGVYSFVWLALRRTEIEKTYGLKTPHWLWLALPYIITLATVIPLAIIGAILAIGNPQLFTAVILTGLVIAVLPTFITVWWIARFGAAAAKVIGGRVPTAWAIVLYLICGFVTVPIYQFYFNRFATAKLPTKKVGPSVKFIALSVALIAVSIASNAFSTRDMLNDLQQMQQDMTTQQQNTQKANDLQHQAAQLDQQYQACLHNLENDFYMSEPADEARYNQAYDECEAIRIDQNRAVDAFEQLNKELFR
jgi:hypothetical protein